MRDSRIKEPSAIYVVTQPFYCCILHAGISFLTKMYQFLV